MIISASSDCFSRLSSISTTLNNTRNDHAQKGQDTLTIFFESIRELHKDLHHKTSFSLDKRNIKNCVCMLLNIFTVHIFGGWRSYVAVDFAHDAFKTFLNLTDKTITELTQVKRTIIQEKKPNAPIVKFFSDMIVYFELLKAQETLMFVNLKILKLPKSHVTKAASSAAVTEILLMLSSLREVCAYLEPKVSHIKQENRVFTGDQSMLKQCFYGTLVECSKAFFIDPVTGKVIESINPKNLLAILREEKVVNNITLTLMLAQGMAQRLISRNNLPFSWYYLEYYFTHIEVHLTKPKDPYIQKQLEEEKSLSKKLISDLVVLLADNIRRGGNDFSVDYTNIQVIFSINKLKPEYRPPELTSQLFAELKQIVQQRQNAHWQSLQILLDTYLRSANTGATRCKAPHIHFLLPKQNDLNHVILVRELSTELKTQRCKIRFQIENGNIRTCDLYSVTSMDLETFCKTYASLVDKQKKSLPDALDDTFEKTHISSNEERTTHISGYTYQKQLAAMPIKEKTRGVATGEIVSYTKPAAETKRSAKFEELFGKEHSHKNIVRCHMKGLDNYYVCLENNDDTKDACTVEERQKFEKLFAEPHQATKIGQQGFKLTRISESKEVMLGAKLLGKSGRLRSYPYLKVLGSDYRSELWLYRTIVSKGSKQEANHVMQTIFETSRG